MSSTLGIYFGPKIITLVEAAGKKVLNVFHLQRSLISGSELDEKVPNDVKIATLFKEELKKCKQDVREVAICLSGKDLIIRTFEIPILPANELPNVINFEVKKYIPFKVEDLVSSYQIALDKPNNRNQILFVGVKKDILDEHVSIARQLDIARIGTVEYSVFAVLRFLKLTSFRNKGITAVMSMDFNEDDEVNFTILENGFPLFSRDIALSGGPEAPQATGAARGNTMLEKLKNEIHISLDYYHRKFPTKKVGQIYFICNDSERADLEAFFNEAAMPAQFINVSRLLGLRQGYSLGFIKAYGVAIFRQVKSDLKINIFSSHLKAGPKKDSVLQLDVKSLFAGIMLDYRYAIAGVLICAVTFGFMFYLKFPVQRQFDEVLAKQLKIAGVDTSAGLEELKVYEQGYKKKLEAMKAVVSGQVYLTNILSAIPRFVPDSICLTNFKYSANNEKKMELSVQGFAYIGNDAQERELISDFAAALRNDAEFNEYFKDIALVNIEHTQFEKVMVTKFSINCKN